MRTAQEQTPDKAHPSDVAIFVHAALKAAVLADADAPMLRHLLSAYEASGVQPVKASADLSDVNTLVEAALNAAADGEPNTVLLDSLLDVLRLTGGEVRVDNDEPWDEVTSAA